MKGYFYLFFTFLFLCVAFRAFLLDLLFVAFLAFLALPASSPAFPYFPASCPLVAYCFSVFIAFVAVAFYQLLSKPSLPLPPRERR